VFGLLCLITSEVFFNLSIDIGNPSYLSFLPPYKVDCHMMNTLAVFPMRRDYPCNTCGRLTASLIRELKRRDDAHLGINRTPGEALPPRGVPLCRKFEELHDSARRGCPICQVVRQCLVYASPSYTDLSKSDCELEFIYGLASYVRVATTVDDLQIEAPVTRGFTPKDERRAAALQASSIRGAILVLHLFMNFMLTNSSISPWRGARGL
jgi:hypothetical protein